METAATSAGEGQAGGFTLQGTVAAERCIRRDLLAVVREVKAAFGGRLRTAVLVGGYARGEGAVETVEGRLRAHNDYDVVVVVRQREAHDAMRARRAGLMAQKQVGVEVDVAVVDEATWRSPPPTLFWMDATHGGARWLCGDPTLQASPPRVASERVPLDEAGRLLANRALGLALTRLGGEAAERGCMIRHGHKAVQAAGDALLLAVRRYAFSLRERAERLAILRDGPSVGPWLVEAYRDSLRYRLDTARWSPEGDSVEDWFDEVSRQVGSVHLTLEAWRTGAPASPLAFARWPGHLFDQKPDARLGDLTAGVRAWLRGDVRDLRPLVHPRERLARVAVALAYGAEPGRQAAVELLGLPASCSNETLRIALLRLRAVGS